MTSVDRGNGLFAGKLTFREPDRAKYPCIDLAYSAGRVGGSMTAVMNGANERANEIFRQEVISVRKADMFPPMEVNEGMKQAQF